MRRLPPGYWDGLAERVGPTHFHEQIALYKRQEHLALIAQWAPSPTDRLLKTDLFEEAHGQDLVLDSLAGTCRAAFGMDISPVVVAGARRRVPAASYMVSDASALCLKDESFDVIVSVSTLDHLPLDSFPRAIDELSRVLRPGGCLILTLDSRHNPLHVFSNALRRWMGQVYAEHCYTVKEVSAIVEKRPLRVTDATAIYHIPFPVNFLAKKAQGVLGSRSDPLIRRLIAIFRRLHALPTRFLTGRYIALRVIKNGR